VSEFFFKSVNIWQSYKQERGCLVHLVCLANTLLKDEESARDNHILACKGKVFPYSLPSVGPGADPGVQAVSPQVT